MAEKSKQDSTMEIMDEKKIQEISADVERNVNEAEDAADKAQGKSEIIQKIKELWVARPKFQDQQQKKSFGHIIKFLAVLLVLTLVAKGTSGATMPRVKLVSLYSGEIIQKITAAGSVVAGGIVLIDAPDGLIVKEVFANAGQKIEKGTQLLRFDIDDIKERYIRENATLKEMNIRLRKLLENTAVDASMVADAKSALANAERIYKDVKTSGESDVTIKTAAQKKAQENLDNPGSGDISELGAALDKANLELAEAINNAKSSLEQARQEVDAAKRSLTDAEKAYANALNSDKEQKEQNAIDAELLRLDIDKQKEKVKILAEVKATDGWLKSEVKGIVMEISSVGSVTATGTPVAKVSDNKGGFDAEISLSKSEAAKVKPGTSADVYVSGSGMYYSSVVTAVITRIAQPDEGGYVRIGLRLPKGDWEQGMSVEVEIIQSQKVYQSCVPLAALHTSSEGYYILTVREQKSVLGIEYVVSKYFVTVSAQDKYSAALDIYLDPSEKIIYSSTKPVEAGDKVRVDAS